MLCRRVVGHQITMNGYRIKYGRWILLGKKKEKKPELTLTRWFLITKNKG